MTCPQSCTTAKCLTRSAPVLRFTSTVVTLPLPTLLTGYTHERMAFPSICTIQAPHCARPQPKRGPRSARSSRNAYRSGMSGSSTCTSAVLSLTTRVIFMSSPCVSVLSRVSSWRLEASRESTRTRVASVTRQRHGEDEQAGDSQQHGNHGHPRVARSDAEQAQHDGVPDQHTTDRAHERAIGEPRSDQIAQDHAHTEYSEHEWHVPFRQPADLGQPPRAIALHTEQCAQSHRPDTERQPDLLAA